MGHDDQIKSQIVWFVKMIPYMAKLLRGELSHFEWKMAICGKTFAVIFLQT